MDDRIIIDSTPKVVIVGLDHAIGLQSARIFARRNIPVIGIARNKKHFCCKTNVCEQILFADTYSDALIDCLISLGKSSGQKYVLILCRDPSVEVVSRYRTELEPYYHFLLPEQVVVDILLDKVGFARMAMSEGFKIPKTYILQNSREAEQASVELTYPCVMKPNLKTDAWEKATDKKVFKLDSKEELLEAYEQFKSVTDALIVQEWVEGEDTNLYSCNCYFNRQSEPLVAFVARKLRQWPPHTGQTSLGEECQDDVVRDESVRFFKQVGFKGLGYLEVKKDARSGEYLFIEPNIGRPTGRSALAEACGVELLYSMYCDLVGLPLPEVSQQSHSGMKWIHLVTDLLSAFQLWRNGELTMVEWLKSIRGKKFFAIWSLADPKPFVWQIPWGVHHLFALKKRFQNEEGKDGKRMLRQS